MLIAADGWARRRPHAVPAKRGVLERFDALAGSYDLLVGMSPGYHRQLRRSARSLVDLLASPISRPAHILDLGCGTGASTRALVTELERAGRTGDLVGVDGSAGMVARAETKRWPAWVRFRLGRAEDLDQVLPVVGTTGADAAGAAGSFDAVFAAYLIRNLDDPDATLIRLYRLLAPGGVLVLHDYSVAGNRRATAVWSLVCTLLLRPLGWVAGRQGAIFVYLLDSVRTFDSVSALMDRLARAGFVAVAGRTVPGWQRGIVHTFVARVPGRP